MEPPPRNLLGNSTTTPRIPISVATHLRRVHSIFGTTIVCLFELPFSPRIEVYRVRRGYTMITAATVSPSYQSGGDLVFPLQNFGASQWNITKRRALRGQVSILMRTRTEIAIPVAQTHRQNQKTFRGLSGLLDLPTEQLTEPKSQSERILLPQPIFVSRGLRFLYTGTPRISFP